MNIIQILEITLIVFAVLFILISLFKQSSAQEALSSISGGSQQLFVNQKVKLSQSLLLLLLIFLAVLIVSLIVVIRIVNNL
ncbi:MAG: hypothetical protein QJQ54_02770 [Mollicutes bacterium]|nr:MAG: hypothetical protein QJQ54_02770 [Mollicutes bacterium]